MIAVDVLRADDAEALAQATAALDAGEHVVIPGDLHYLLAADALNDAALAALFDATSRPADKPLVVCVAGYEDHQHVAFGGPLAQSLAAAEWPGPTVLALRPRPWVPDAVTAGGERVLVNAPAQAFAAALARHFGPFAIVAATREGAESPRRREDARVAARLAVDAGALAGGESRVIDATGEEAKLIRAGTRGAR